MPCTTPRPVSLLGVPLACAVVLALAWAPRANAQLQVGGTNLLGFHSNPQKRPVYYYAGGLLTDPGPEGEGAGIGATLGLGYAKAITPRLYLGAEGGVRPVGFQRDDFGEPGPGGVGVDVFGYVGLAAFVSTSRRNRDFFKLGLPLLSSRESFVSPLTMGLVSYFGRKDYEAPARTRGPVTDQPGAIYLEGRYGAVVAARGAGIKAGYSIGRFDLNAGLLARSTGETPWSSRTESRSFDYSATVGLGITIRRRGDARTQLVGEGLLALGARADRNGTRRLGGGILALRYEQPLAGNLAVAVEGGLATEIETARGPGERLVTVFFPVPHGALGIRYRLGGRSSTR